MRHFKLLFQMVRLVFGGRLIVDLFWFIRNFFVSGASVEQKNSEEPQALPEFSSAVEKMGYKEKDLQERAFQLKIEFWVFFVIFMVSLLFMAANLSHGGMAIIGSLSVILLSGVRVMIASYRFWNIRARKIHTISQWLKTPSAWVPSS